MAKTAKGKGVPYSSQKPPTKRSFLVLEKVIISNKD
jgi:hypothetical protein